MRSVVLQDFIPEDELQLYSVRRVELKGEKEVSSVPPGRIGKDRVAIEVTAIITVPKKYVERSL